MADLTYLIRISHHDKGIAYTAKTALQNAQRGGWSPIKRVSFSGQPSSNNTELEVVIDDAALPDFIRKAIDSSGRMPQKPGIYSIDSIELVTESEDMKERMASLQRQQSAHQQQLTSLREENALLRSDFTRREIRSPLEGLLAYFETIQCSPETVIESPGDFDFARRIFSGEMKNTFVDYVNHVLSREFAEGEIERILSYHPPSPEAEEEAASRLRYETAKSELVFLERLKSGNAEIPASLQAEYIAVIEARKPQETVQEYEAQVRAQEETRTLHEKIAELKGKYASFAEQFTLLSHAGSDVPVIFHWGGNHREIYFPFKVRDTKAGFIEDLQRELGSYYNGGGATVEVVESKFVAYRLPSTVSLRDMVERITEETPFSLRLAGFNRIIPYQLG